MLLVLLGFVAAAPIYWFLVPERIRKDYLAVASIVGLAFLDIRLPVVVLTLAILLLAATRLIKRMDGVSRHLVAVLGIAALLGVFLFNKLAPGGEVTGPLALQGGLVLIGISYFVLKAAAILIETARGSLDPPAFSRLLRWLVFLPIFTSGPIEEFNHFDGQQPTVDRDQILAGLERILWGCVRALVFGRILREWAFPILTSPGDYPQVTLLLAAYAFTLYGYCDFAGYSDVAIGLAALYGYRIQENFDNPLMQRNVSMLWQRCHMTLTGWMRSFIFIPLTRSIMRRGGVRSHGVAIATGHIVCMLFCALWHVLSWQFALWGLCHAVGLVWVSVGARRAGRLLPQGFVHWWRQSQVGYAMSWFLTITWFCLVNTLMAADLSCLYRVFVECPGIGR